MARSIKNQKVYSSITLIIFIILSVVLAFFMYKYTKVKNTQVNEKPTSESNRTAPLIHRKEFPVGFVGKDYITDIIASIALQGEIPVIVNGLPEGLTLQNCATTYDVRSLPVMPNSVTRCIVAGTPRKSGTFSVKIDAKNPSGITNTIQDIIFVIEE